MLNEWEENSRDDFTLLTELIPRANIEAPPSWKFEACSDLVRKYTQRKLLFPADI